MLSIDGKTGNSITTLKVPDLTQSYGSTPAPTAPRY